MIKTKSDPCKDAYKLSSYQRIDIGARSTLEDKAIKISYEGGYLVGVFDGHGGDDVSYFCVQNIVYVLDEIKHQPWNERIGNCLINLNFKLMRETCFDYKQGTTAVLTYITNNGTIYVANVGDARCMIINTKTGKIMEKQSPTDISSYDMETTLFAENGIYVENNPYKYSQFVTRSHVYDIKSVEYQYYTKKGFYYQKDDNGSMYLHIDPLFNGIEPNRALGDTKYLGKILSKPEVYCWHLCESQIQYATILIMSDGIENHECFTHDKIAHFVCDPMMSLTNINHFISDTFIGMNGIIPKNMLTDGYIYIEKNLEKIHNILCNMLKEDKLWLDAINTGYYALIENLSNYRNDPLNLQVICDLIINCAKCIGSDDNITLIGIKF